MAGYGICKDKTKPTTTDVTGMQRFLKYVPKKPLLYSLRLKHICFYLYYYTNAIRLTQNQYIRIRRY